MLITLDVQTQWKFAKYRTVKHWRELMDWNMTRLTYTGSLIKTIFWLLWLILSGKANHVLYKPEIGTTDMAVLPKVETRPSRYHFYPLAAKWRKSSINSSIDVLTEVDNRDDSIWMFLLHVSFHYLEYFYSSVFFCSAFAIHDVGVSVDFVLKLGKH